MIRLLKESDGHVEDGGIAVRLFPLFMCYDRSEPLTGATYCEASPGTGYASLPRVNIRASPIDMVF